MLIFLFIIYFFFLVVSLLFTFIQQYESYCCVKNKNYINKLVIFYQFFKKYTAYYGYRRVNIADAIFCISTGGGDTRFPINLSYNYYKTKTGSS